MACFTVLLCDSMENTTVPQTFEYHSLMLKKNVNGIAHLAYLSNNRCVPAELGYDTGFLKVYVPTFFCAIVN